MSKLFEPFQIKEVKFNNRIVMSPMCQYSAHDGYANNWHLVHYGSRAVGKAGTVMVEATAVSPEGRISENDLGIYYTDHVKKLKEITAFIEEHGAVPGIQLAHAGRKAHIWSPSDYRREGKENEKQIRAVAPSAIKFKDSCSLPKKLDATGIEKIKNDFKIAAQRAVEAGFKVIEIHAAHGYLLHEFLSPLTNKRDDQYGGSFENRIKLLLETVDIMNDVLQNKLPLFVRISATDWVDKDGWDLAQSIELAKILKKKGVDVIDVSSGGLISKAVIAVGAGYQLSFAHSIKKAVKDLMVGAVGMITNAVQAETILFNNQADLIFLGREFLRNPYFPIEAAKKLKTEIDLPIQYIKAK